MTTIQYPDVPVNADGLATHWHIASHHVHGIEGGAEVTLCGVLIIYSTWKGVMPDAPPCATCESRDG